MKKPLFLSTALLALLFASCSTNPASRIKSNPAIYNDLSPSQQELVREGQIEPGMSKPAVFLAMGKADRELVSVQQDKKIEIWNYNTLQPVYGSSFRFGYGGYSNRFSRRSRGGFGHRSDFGFGYSPSISYIPRVGSSIQFENDRVTGWQGIRR